MRTQTDLFPYESTGTLDQSKYIIANAPALPPAPVELQTVLNPPDPPAPETAKINCIGITLSGKKVLL